MESKGWIEIDAPRHRVFVDTALWLGMNAKLKEDFTCTMADACAERSQSGIENVTLIDKQSARNLATWKVDMWGSPQFTVY